jgi:hypothetical protein
MIFKKLPKQNADDPQTYARVDGDGVIRVTCGESHPDLQAWIAAGNTPQEPDPVPVVIPQTVSMAQARLALIGAGLFSTIDAGLKALPEPQRTTALTAWEYAPTVSRNGALVTTLAGQFGLTEAQLDALFTAAAAIEL